MNESFKLPISMLDNMCAGIYVLDKDGTYIYCNAAMTNGAGTSLLGQNVHDLLKNNIVDVCISDIVRGKKEPVTMVQQIRLENRPAYQQIITSTPIFDAEGEIEYFFTELYNISGLNWRYQQALLNEQVQQMLVSRSSNPRELPSIVGQSTAMQALLGIADKICDIDTPVLIYGESGTGKEVIARYLHEHSKRRHREMVVINCASLPESLLEAELFGYEKGAFTGALQTGKRGLIEEAEGSTLFLDEINSLPLSTQGKLLRVLETHMVQKIGAIRAKYVDFRLVTATNQNLFDCVQKGSFRLDLYYRLNVVPLNIPPLRERPADIIPLANHFLQQYCQRYNRMKLLSTEVYDAMLHYAWPGNVRELKNFVERVVVMSADNVLTIQSVPDSFFSSSLHQMETHTQPILGFEQPHKPDFSQPNFSLKEYLAKCEKEIIEAALAQFGSTYKAGKYLGMDQSSIARKKQKYNIKY